MLKPVGGPYPLALLPLNSHSQIADLYIAATVCTALQVLWSGPEHERPLVLLPDTFCAHNELKQHHPHCPYVISHIIHDWHLS